MARFNYGSTAAGKRRARKSKDTFESFLGLLALPLLPILLPLKLLSGGKKKHRKR